MNEIIYLPVSLTWGESFPEPFLREAGIALAFRTPEEAESYIESNIDAYPCDAHGVLPVYVHPEWSVYVNAATGGLVCPIAA